MTTTKRAPSAKSELTAARIVAASKTLFVASNYADVTTEMIAQASGVTKGGLYHHFASKEQLYITLMLDDLAKKQHLFAQAVLASGTARERLTKLTQDFLEMPDEDRELSRLVRRDVNTFARHEREILVGAYQKALPDQIEAIISDGIRDGELAPGDSRILAWSFVALVEVVISDYAGCVFSSTAACLDHVLGLFFDGAANPSTQGET